MPGQPIGSINLTSEVDGQEGAAATAASPLDMKERQAVDVTIVSQPFMAAIRSGVSSK